MKLKFTKMHGLGKDYIVIDNTNDFLLDINLSNLSKILCDRNYGIGASGLIVITNSLVSDFFALFYNQDGKEQAMCATSIRCLAKYVYDNKLTNLKKLNVFTKAGVIHLSLNVDEAINKVTSVSVNMGSPDFNYFESYDYPNKIYVKKTMLEVNSRRFYFTPIYFGTPNAVTFVRDLDNFDLIKYGKVCESGMLFSDINNFCFIEVINKNKIKVRCYERGIGESNACSSGACASAFVSNIEGKTLENVNVLMPGGTLNVSIEEFSSILSGPCEKVFDGQIELDLFDI